MKFVVSREALLRPLQLITAVVERRQTLPVLSNVLMNVDGETLSLTGTDLEVQMVANLPLPGSVETGGEVTVPARKLMEIWRALPDEADVELAFEDQRAVIRSGRSRFTLATLPAADFPAIDEGEVELELNLEQGALRRLVERAAFSMAQQDVRYFLNGMLLEVEPDHVRTVATDGHRLAMCTLEHDTGASSRQVIVPRKGVLELGRLLGESEEPVAVRLGPNHLRASVSGFDFTTKLVDGRFPDYDKVIPRGTDREVLADRSSLREAFQRTAILSNEKYRGVRVTLGDETLTVQANNPEQEEAEEAVPVAFRGEPLEIGFNVSYLLDVLGALESSQVRIALSDANSSAVLQEPEGGDALYVVMPMRL